MMDLKENTDSVFYHEEHPQTQKNEIGNQLEEASSKRSDQFEKGV